MVVGARRIRSQKLRECQYKDMLGLLRERELNGMEIMWEQVKVNGRKCKISVWFSEHRGKEPKVCDGM